MQEEATIRKKNVGITKSTAKNNISLLLDTVKRINKSNNKYKYPHRIKDIVLFGSYLTDKEKLGDIDIFFNLDRRWDDLREMEKHFAKVRPYTTFIQYLYNAQFLTLKLLRNKKPSFSFSNLDFHKEFIEENNVNHIVLVENFKLTNNQY
ncbi:MAG: nucleotidyltransferase domain-containing protein [Candidatus Kapaibacteriota bacterium]